MPLSGYCLLFCGLIFSACSSGAPTKGDVIVYVAGPLSGFQANTGQTVAGGVRLMAEQLNRSGGLLGYKVKVVALDDEADSDVAAGVAAQIKEAVDRGDRVLGVIGHPNSGQTAAAMDVYKDLAIIVITPTASEVGLTQQGYRNFFRVNAANDLQAKTGADYLTNKLGAKKVAVLYNDDSYGIDLGKLVAAELTKLGAQVPVSLQVKVEQNRFPSEVAKIKAAGVDAIYYAGYEVECPYLRADLRDAGLDKLTLWHRTGASWLQPSITPTARPKGCTSPASRPARKPRWIRPGCRATRRWSTATPIPTRSTATAPWRCWPRA